MIYPLYSIRDVQTGFMSPTVDMNDNAAARNFAHAIQASDGVMHTHASDFDLFKIGSFDTDNGQLDLIWPLVLVMSGGDVDAI